MNETPRPTKEELMATGYAMRSRLGGEKFNKGVDHNVYSDPHMKKFSDMFVELIFAQVWTRDGIDMKTRTLITLISDISTGAFDALSIHCRFCRNHGWTEDEIVECFIHLTAYLGIPKVRKAILIASQTFKDMREKGEMPDWETAQPQA